MDAANVGSGFPLLVLPWFRSQERESHENRHDYDTGEDLPGNTLCFHQAKAHPHDPRREWLEVAIHGAAHKEDGAR